MVGYATLSALDGASSSNKFVRQSVVAAASGADGLTQDGGSKGSGRISSSSIAGRFREVKRAIGWPSGAPEFEWIQVPCPKTGGTRAHPIICPIAFMEAINKRQARWENNIVGDAGLLKQVWDGLKAKRDCLYVDNMARIGNTDRCLIFNLHGDGAPTHKKDGLYTFSYGSLTGQGATKQCRFPYTVVRRTEESMAVVDVLVRRLAWSFNAMLAGVYPADDFYGNPHPKAGQPLDLDGWRVCMLHLHGDWEFYQQMLGFPAPNGVPNNCFVCAASPTVEALLYTIARLGAGWRTTVRTHSSYLLDLARKGAHLPSLFAILSLRFEGIMIDTMHCCDLGVCSHLVANVLVELLDQFAGSTVDARVEALEEHLNEWTKATGSDIRLRGRLTIARLRTSGDWPKLAGKAAESRHMVDYALHLSQKFQRPGNTRDARRTAMCQLLQEFYGILSGNGAFLSAVAADRVGDLARDFVTIYGKFAREALLAGIRAWKMPPKFHLWVHLCEIQALHMNPRLYWAYMDEDMQQQIKLIALSTHPRTMCENVLYKWIVLVFGCDM